MKTYFMVSLGIISWILLAVCPSTGQSINVTSSYSPDYHFKVNGSDFFPIGWYNTITSTELQTAKNNGANIVFCYWNAVRDNYHPSPSPANYNLEGYRIALINFLGTVNTLGLKAIVHLGVEDSSQYGFTNSGISSLVESVANHPAVFGWYLFDEPYGRLLRNCGVFPTSAHLRAIADTIRAVERRKLGSQKHPIMPVVDYSYFFPEYNYLVAGTTYNNPPCTMPWPAAFDPSSYDAVMMDSYVFSIQMDNNTYPWHDFNNVSRTATNRGVTHVKNYGKMGFIFVGMAHDKYHDSIWTHRQLTPNDVKYQSLSPIIQGARGLLYYWWFEPEASIETRTNVNNFIKFFTDTKLNEVIMKGEIKDNSLSLANFTLDGVLKSPNEYTWRNYHNLGWNVPSNDPEFKQFNYIVRKYKGSYYLFAVNDFKKTVQTDFVLDGLLGSNESVYQIVELNVDGTQTQKNFSQGSTIRSGRFTDVFNRYDTKVYRMDVFAWSPTYSIGGVAWETSGGGICIGDFNNNGKKDFCVMAISNEPSAADPFRFKIGWDIQKQSNGTIYFNDESCSNFPSTCYGQMSGTASETSGGGLAAYDLNGNGKSELFFMGINKLANAADPFRFKIGWDVIRQSNATIYFNDRSCLDFPSLCYGEMSGPTWETTGGDIAVHDIDGNGKPEMFFMDIDNLLNGANELRYKIGWNVTIQTAGTIYFNDKSCSDFPNYCYGKGGAIGWETAGGGIEVGDIDNDGQKEMVFLGIESTTNRPRFIIYNLNPNGNIETWWRPYSEILLDVTYAIGSSGIALADLDNDGDLDMSIMGVEKTPQADNFKLRFGINGRISNGNNPFVKEVVHSENVEAKDRKSSVDDYVLNSNYPNPFNPTTTIKYSLAKASKIVIKIYNTLGQEIRTLVERTESPGNNAVVWDGRDSFGHEVSPGVYIYRMIVNNELVLSNKMLLLK